MGTGYSYFAGKGVQALTAELVVDCQNALGESPVYDADTNTLYWVDIEGKTIWQMDTTSGEQNSYKLKERPGCIGLTAESGKLLVALDKTGMATFNTANGKISKICDFEADLPNTRANDGRTDRQGRFLIGGYNETWREDGGQEISGYYRLDANSKLTEVLDTKFRCANGTAVSPEGTTVYLTDSPKREIMKYDYDVATGALLNPQVFYAMPEGDEGVPDGAQVDSEGHLYVAYNGGGKVCRHNRDTGAIELELVLPDGWRGVTSCTFGGVGHKTLYITTNRRRMTFVEKDKFPKAGALYSVNFEAAELPIEGVPEIKFQLDGAFSALTRKFSGNKIRLDGADKAFGTKTNVDTSLVEDSGPTCGMCVVC